MDFKTFYDFYENLEYSKKRTLKAEIIGLLEIDSSTFSQRKNGKVYFTKPERLVIEWHLKEKYGVENIPENFFNYEPQTINK